MEDSHFYGTIDGIPFLNEERERELAEIIAEENLKEAETRKFIENAFRNGDVKTIGTDIDRLIPEYHASAGTGEKEQTIIDKLKAFFEKFFGKRGSI